MREISTLIKSGTVKNAGIAAAPDYVMNSIKKLLKRGNYIQKIIFKKTVKLSYTISRTF